MPSKRGDSFAPTHPHTTVEFQLVVRRDPQIERLMNCGFLCASSCSSTAEMRASAPRSRRPKPEKRSQKLMPQLEFVKLKMTAKKTTGPNRRCNVHACWSLAARTPSPTRTPIHPIKCLWHAVHVRLWQCPPRPPAQEGLGRAVGVRRRGRCGLASGAAAIWPRQIRARLGSEVG